MSQYRKLPPRLPTVEAFQIEHHNLVEFIKWAKKHEFTEWAITKDGVEVERGTSHDTAVYARHGGWVTKHEKDATYERPYFRAWTDANFRATFEPVETGDNS